jgi:hypothetical protein
MIERYEIASHRGVEGIRGLAMLDDFHDHFVRLIRNFAQPNRVSATAVSEPGSTVTCLVKATH